MKFNFQFSAKKLYESSSPVNGKMFVFEEDNRRRLAVGKFNYSLYANDRGDLLTDRYWGKLALGIKKRKTGIDKILILGLGAGTFVHLFNHYFKPSVVDGIELDPEVIKIGREFFYLSSAPNLNVYIADACTWVYENQNTKANYYDLIVFDLYKAVELPQECEGRDFLTATFRLLKNDGMVTFNRVCRRNEQDLIVKKFKEENLAPFFQHIEQEDVKGALEFSNHIIYASLKKEL